MATQDPSQAADAVSAWASYLPGWLAALLTLCMKFLPPLLGAVVMVLFDMPSTRREWFIRIAGAFVCSQMLSPLFFDLLHSFSWFAFLDHNNRNHFGAIEFLCASFGWSLLAAWATWQRKFRADPRAAVTGAIQGAGEVIHDAKEAIK